MCKQLNFWDPNNKKDLQGLTPKDPVKLKWLFGVSAGKIMIERTMTVMISQMQKFQRFKFDKQVNFEILQLNLTNVT